VTHITCNGLKAAWWDLRRVDESNDWSDVVADSLKKQQEAQQLCDRKFVEQQRLKRAWGPRLWMEVSKQIEVCCAALNQSRGEQILTFKPGIENDVIVVYAKVLGKHHELSVEFDGEQGRLTWQASRTIGNRLQ
jgi:hypothetical protein